MADRFSTNLKAILVMEDLSNGSFQFSQQDCLTIQDFHYCCNRGKNDEGIVGGVTGSSMMSMSVRLHELSENKRFYDGLISRSPSPFTILFNAEFGNDGKLKDYENAMTVFGYIVDVQEHFSTMVGADATSAPMSIHIEIQLTKMVFHGKDSSKTLDIIHTDE